MRDKLVIKIKLKKNWKELEQKKKLKEKKTPNDFISKYLMMVSFFKTGVFICL